MVFQQDNRFRTPGRGTYDITAQVRQAVARSGIRSGLCQVFVHHTSASLALCENADPDVRTDLETILARLAPDGDPAYLHCSEGRDDMAAHVRTILTKTDLGIPVRDGQLLLGAWQGIFLWEHRTQAHDRRFTVTLVGDP